MRRISALCFLVLLLSPAGVAQSLFSADLDGSQEVPAVASGACGWAMVTLNPDASVTYEVHVTGLSGAGATAAHLHTGAAGVNGSVLVTLTGGPETWAGTSAPLSASDVTKLRTEGLYVNVHSSNHSGGEIRGQLVNAAIRFGAHLRGAQVEPAIDTTATGTLDVTLNPDGSLTYSLDVQNMVGTAATLNVGAIGGNGAVLVTLAGGPSSWSGTTAPLSADDLAVVQQGGLYALVQSATHPLGQARGQLLPSSLALLAGCADLVLSASGAPTPFGGIDVSITGAAPNSMGLLLGSSARGLEFVLGEPVIVDVPSLVIKNTVIALDAAGNASMHFPLDMLASTATLTWQFFDVDAGAPNGLFQASNGLQVTLVDLPQGIPLSYANDIHAIFSDPLPSPSSGTCVACHDAGHFSLDLSGDEASTHPLLLSLIDLADPVNSTLLTKPLGVFHSGGTKFPDTNYGPYQSILSWIQAGAPNN